MSKSEAKKAHILNCGLEAMKANGYNGTSVKDIVDAAGVPKGSFYNYFESKESFALEAIGHASEETYQRAAKLLNSDNQSPLWRLTQFFTENSADACDNEFRVGCFLGNMCQEMADNSEAIRAKTNHVLGQMVELIAGVIKQAQQQSEANDQLDTELAAEFIFNAWEGALMKMKASKNSQPLDAFLTMLPVVLAR